MARADRTDRHGREDRTLTNDDLWGVLVEGPTVQTHPTEHLAGRYADQLQAFWGGPRPILVRRDSLDGDWQLAAGITLGADKLKHVEEVLRAFNDARQGRE